VGSFRTARGGACRAQERKASLTARLRFREQPQSAPTTAVWTAP